MEKHMQIIKPIVKVGNSAGVILPRGWLNGKAKIELVEKPMDIKKDVFEILEPYLNNIQGIYLVGSYARNEQTSKSDIDILIITNKIHKIIEQGKYNLIIVTKSQVERALKNNIMPILPMLKESKSLLNSSLIESYKKTPLTKNNLKWHIETTKSALNVNKAAMDLDKLSSSKTSDATAYSLTLRLRGVYIVDCLINDKKWSNKGLLSLTKTIAGSLKAYEGYMRKKNNKKIKEDLPIKQAEKLHGYINKKIKEQKKWLARRRSKKL